MIDTTPRKAGRVITGKSGIPFQWLRCESEFYVSIEELMKWQAQAGFPTQVCGMPRLIRVNPKDEGGYDYRWACEASGG